MQHFIFFMIIIGAIIMVTNIVRYVIFIRSTRDVLSSGVSADDAWKYGHSRHVRNLTMAIYRHLPQQQRKKINPVSLEFAALMHDIGKLGIPENILNKPAKLSDEEWVIMKDHPRLGTRILAPLKSFQTILPWIEYHHEWVNGNGYYHKTAEQIPFEAKIISIADVYSAITMRRSYKEPKAHEEAVRLMKKESGTHLDAELMALFCTIPQEELLGCIPESLDI